MKKLRELRLAIINAVPALAENPDKLLTFVEEGSGNDRARSPSLSFRYDYTAVVILTDFSGDVDAVLVALNAWLKVNQPDRGNDEFVKFVAEILDNDTVDLELKVSLTESVAVAVNADGTTTVTHVGEATYNRNFEQGQPADTEWDSGRAY